MSDQGAETGKQQDPSIQDVIRDLIARERENVGPTYPADYMYHPLKNEGGQPLLARVGEDTYSVWMKRSEPGGPFTHAVLLDALQLDQIYLSRPGPRPDVPEDKVDEAKEAGKMVFINPDLPADDPKRVIDASTLSKVSYDPESGIIPGASGRSRVRRSSNLERVLLPTELVKDGKVSDEDLKQKLEGYQISPELILTEKEDAANKARVEGPLKQEVRESMKVLIAAKAGATLPGTTQAAFETDIVVKDKAELAKITNLEIEAGLRPPKVEVDKPVVEEKAFKQDFQDKMQKIVDQGAGAKNPDSPLKGFELTQIKSGLREISGRLASDTEMGYARAMQSVDSLCGYFPEHRDLIAEYALAESKDPTTDEKAFIKRLEERLNKDKAPEETARLDDREELEAAVQGRLAAINRNNVGVRLDQYLQEKGIDPDSLGADRRLDMIDDVIADVRNASTQDAVLASVTGSDVDLIGVVDGQIDQTIAAAVDGIQTGLTAEFARKASLEGEPLAQEYDNTASTIGVALPGMKA